MSVGELAPPPVFQAFATNGAFLAGGQLFSFAAGTSVPQPTYVDSTLTTQNSNPVILNGYGQANVWFDPTLVYKLVLEDASGNIQPGYPVDQINPYLTSASLTATLGSYATIASLSAFVQTSALAAALAPYQLISGMAAFAPLSSPAFTNIPTAPTATPGTNTAQLATTAFVAAATQSPNRSGSFTCVNGVIAVTFATPFPTTCTGVFVQWNYASPDVGFVVPGSVTASGFSYSNGNSGACYYFAVGN
jgi:hypothetical protein